MAKIPATILAVKDVWVKYDGSPAAKMPMALAIVYKSTTNEVYRFNNFWGNGGSKEDFLESLSLVEDDRNDARYLSRSTNLIPDDFYTEPHYVIASLDNFQEPTNELGEVAI